MSSVSGSVVIVVLTIGVGEMGRIVETSWIGGDVIQASEMRFGATACIVET